MSAKFKFDYMLVSVRGSIFVADTEKVLAVFPSKSGIAESVSAALAEIKAKKRSKVIVLADEFFRQKISLPTVQVQGLSPQELTSALCYEIEPFSNISEKAGLLGFEKLEHQGNDAVFDVLQVSDSEYMEISKSVEVAGCSLLGAGGLPDGWAADTGPENFAEFVKSIIDGTSCLPFVKKASGGIIPENPFPLAVLLAGIVAVVCLIDMLAIKSSLSSLRPDIARRSAMAASNQSKIAEISSINAEYDRLKKAEEDRAAADRKAGLVSAAWSRLFEAMGTVSADVAVITTVSADGDFCCKVEALSATVEGAGRYMKLLNERLKDSGWTLSPGGFSSSPRGGAVAFSFVMSFGGF